MDKDQKELVSKAVKTAQEKVQPHLTAGKGLMALGAGVVLYALANSQPVKPVTDQAVVSTQSTNVTDQTTASNLAMKEAKESSQAKEPAKEGQITLSKTVRSDAQKAAANSVEGIKDSKVSPLVKVSEAQTVGEKTTLSEPEKQQKTDVAKSTESAKSPTAAKVIENKAVETKQVVGNPLSNSVVVDDTPIKSSDHKTLDELSKWAKQSDGKAAKAGSTSEEQDVMGNAPALAEGHDDATLPPLEKEKAAAVKDDAKTAEGNTVGKKGRILPHDPLVSTLIEPVDKNAATGLADSEPAGKPEKMADKVREDAELGQANPFIDATPEKNQKVKAKAKTGLLSTPLPKDVEAQIISKLADSAKKRKTTGLLSAPIEQDAEQGKTPDPQKAPSQKSNQGNSVKQGTKPMNHAEPIKSEGHATSHDIKKSSKSNVSEFTLKNGMEVIVIPDHRAPVVTHMVWYKVGAVDEPMGKSGIAHFLEHLMFKGTDKIASGEFSKIIAKNGGQDNAFTSMDTTAYHERVAKDRLRMVMEMEADRMRNLTLSEKDVLTERDVILEERRSRTDNKPSAQFREQMESALYMNHPYGMPIIGWLHEMKQLSREDALQFYRRFYAPNNAVLVVAGDVTAEEVEKLATEIYEPIKAEETVIRADRAQEPPHRAPRRLTMHHKRVAKATWQRFYLAPGYSNAAKEGEVEALDLLFKILGDGTTGRLYKSMVVKDKIAENAGAYYSGDSLDGGKMVFYGIGAKGVTLSAVEAAVDKEIALIKAKGVTQKELDAARNAYSAAYVYANDNQVSLANRYGFAKVRGRTIAQVEGWPDMLKKVTIEDIQKVAQKYIMIEKSVTGELLPEETKKAEGKAKADKG